MKRRSFLQAIVALVGAVFAPAVPAATRVQVICTAYFEPSYIDLSVAENRLALIAKYRHTQYGYRIVLENDEMRVERLPEVPAA